MVKSGSWMAGWVVPGIALQAHPAIPHPGYTLPTRPGWTTRLHPCWTRLKDAVGLISVDQLSLSVQFSGLQGFTEGYNLIRIGRINNHIVIPGTK